MGPVSVAKGQVLVVDDEKKRKKRKKKKKIERK